MDALTVIGIIAGGIIGGVILHRISGGCLIGALLGWLLARSISQNRKLTRLEQRLRETERALFGEKAEQKPAADEELLETPALFRQAKAEQVPAPVISVSEAAPAPQPEPAPAAAEQTEIKRSPPARPSFEERIAATVKAFFTEGNVILRIGLLLLFFGVAFLLKYAADRNLISIELRLLSVMLGGMALLFFGWRQRATKPGFALLAQGGGIGIMYLTVFAAFKLYELLPAPLAFALMLGLVAASTALALLQDSSPLALFGAAGGFLAPVLLSTDSGNHVALFSYYALLNSGILAVSWFRAWRSLNLLGFIFTLGIGAAWGLHSYQPQHFATAEPFLILFFLMFNAIGVLFAFRQTPNLRGYIDGTLIFGTPAVCFSLQAGMVHDMPHGLAYSALAVSLFYIVLARWLWNQGNERLRQGMRTLTEAFLALGIVFVTLAVPLALSGRWTAVTWAMEGAALIWVGIRQHRFLARSSGFLLQFGAGFFFLSGHRIDHSMALLNGQYLGAAIIALSAFFASWQFYKAENLRRCERWNHLPLFFWACLWWHFSMTNEISISSGPDNLRDHVILLFDALSCAVMARLAWSLNWPPAAWPSLCLPFLIAEVMGSNLDWNYVYPGTAHPFGGTGWAVWPLAFAMCYYCLRKAQGLVKKHCLQLNHFVSFLLLTFIVTIEAAWWMRRLTGGAGVWKEIVCALVPTGMVLLAHHRRLETRWPISDHAAVYQLLASGMLAARLWLWLLGDNFGNPGNDSPLPFYPIFNMLDRVNFAALLLFVLFAQWMLRYRDYYSTDCLPKLLRTAIWTILSTLFGISLFFLSFWSSFNNPGNAEPLPFIPLLNPLELSQIVVMLLLVWWVARHRDIITHLPKPLLPAIGAYTAFLWLNTVLARAVHHWAGVSFRVEPMLSSRIYQTSLAILWALLSLALMAAADRWQSRKVWFAGCALIGITVLKLFLIDLATSGTVERIVSFISVGILVIVISWFSPLPPKKEESK